MPSRVPFIPSRNNYTLGIPIGGVRYLFSNIHWNSRDSAWYFDLSEEDTTPILAGFKVTLGTQVTKASTHSFFLKYKLDVVDTEASHIDAKYDDLGARIQVLVTSFDEVMKAGT